MAKLIILVHGLGGTSDRTWGNFPPFLDEDENVDFEIVQYGYQSPPVYKFWQRGPSILNIANGLLTDICNRCDLENDEIVLAGHSLGGLVVKKMLLRLKDKKLNHNIKKVCFFDVPHDGSGFANVGKYISPRNWHLKSLCRDSSELDDLNDQWVDSGLDNILEILSVVAANDDVVSSGSSKSIFRHHQVETINGVNHKSIVKPESTSSSSYLVFKNFILKRSTVSRYRNIASRNLNDWKRVERNHSYHYVSDERRDVDLESLANAIDKKQSIVRLTGASGLGKTRLLLEAIEKSSSVNDECILVFNAPAYEREVRESVRLAVDDNVHGLIIVENCNIDLHNELVKEIKKTDCNLRIVTIGYSHDPVDDSIHIQLLPLSDEAIKTLLTPILVDLPSSDVERVAIFAQGYPLMATLIAEQYKKEGKLIGSISESSVVRKLIHGDNGINDAEQEILSACSLFDVFGTEEGEARKEAAFIAEQVANSTLSVFDKVMHVFTKRQIISRAGRYARLVPKPLALTLAADWWKESSYDRQKHLIDSLPDSLIHSFCTQASYLDAQPSVQRFSERLFSINGPFVQAEVLLTEKGSKLFRALVEVNPEVTGKALYNVLKSLSDEQLHDIKGDTRRNLVWGLEKLCFHSHLFEEASWCMLLLASEENESWSNNATGMFTQLFRINLSGAGAPPKVRFDILKKALGLNQLKVDMVVLEALDQSISTFGGSRTVGAEYQGTKAPLEEWKPKSWQEIFDYWQEAFDLLLDMFSRGETQKNKVMNSIGHSIRGFVSRGRIDMLDAAIRTIVSENGRYWPAALENIKHAFEHDLDGLDEPAINALNSWLALLNPNDADFAEKLKIIVINPPWEHKKGDDGHYIDVAAENAKVLANDVANDIDSLLPCLSLLLQGEQKQSYSFGRQLALKLTETDGLIDIVLELLVVAEPVNASFVLGLYRGVYEKSPDNWQEHINRLLSDDRLVIFYPEFIRTGNIQKRHLDELLKLIRSNVISANSANALSYGSVTDSLDPEVIAEFSLSLAAFGGKAAWPALNVVFMYCFSNKDCVERIRDQLKILVTSVPLFKDQKETVTDVYHWHDMAENLLKVHDEEFAVSLSNQLIDGCQYGFNHGDLWNYIKPLLLDLMREYGDTLWSIFGEAIVQAKGLELYWLQQLLDRENSFSNQMPSVLSALPVEIIIAWCEKYPELGPTFTAECVDILATVDEEQKPSELFVSLLEHFGDDERVANSLSANMGTRGWTGSLVPYLESDKVALSPLLAHESESVRRWVRDHISRIDRQIASESNLDEERNLGRY
jgi:hypothetical protein